MSVKRKKESHLWERDPHDWYVEPKACSRALFSDLDFTDGIWDPACGLGHIPESAREAGIHALGSDIVTRGGFVEWEQDFLSASSLPDGVKNIVSNPPFSLAEDFVLHGLEILPIGGKMAFILPMVWLSGFSKKRDWLPNSPLLKYLAISPRPSMPPGKVIQAGLKPGNGTKDYAWFVWCVGYNGEPSVGFLNTNKFKGF